MTDEDKILCEYILENGYVNPNEEIAYPPSSISMGEKEFRGVKYDIPISTFGNIVFVQAPPKSMKTFFISLISSAYLSGGNKYTGKLKGNYQGKLMHVDTEQGTFHALKTFQRPCRMSEINTDNYLTFALRPYAPRERTQFIDWYLANHEVKFLIIDGIADLVNDVNDLKECNKMIQKLMKWSEKYDMTIITVIHTNYGSDKPTGHLGSAIEKKCEAQINLTFDGSLASVTCKRTRNFAFEDFEFEIDNSGLPTIIQHPI
jgi:hypothetical protein